MLNTFPLMWLSPVINSGKEESAFVSGIIHSPNLQLPVSP
jgi:hypothetical protein